LEPFCWCLGLGYVVFQLLESSFYKIHTQSNYITLDITVNDEMASVLTYKYSSRYVMSYMISARYMTSVHVSGHVGRPIKCCVILMDIFI